MTHFVVKRRTEISHHSFERRSTPTIFLCSGSFRVHLFYRCVSQSEQEKSNFHRNVVKGKVTSLERSEIVLFLWHFSFSFCSLSRVCVRLENLFSFWFDVFFMESETPNNTFLLPVSCSTPHLVLLTIETSFRRSKRVEESSRFVDDLIERIQNYIRLCLSLFI